MTDSLIITVIVLTLSYVIYVLLTGRAALIELFNCKKATYPVPGTATSTTPSRTIANSMKSLVLPFYQQESKVQHFLNCLRSEHFAWSLVNLSLFDMKRRYSRRIRQATFGFVHLLSVLSVVSLLVLNGSTLSECNHNLSEKACQEATNRRYSKLSFRSLSARSCHWNSQDSRCELHLSLSGNPSQWMSLLFLQMLIVSMCLSPIHALSAYCCDKVHDFFDYYLFAVSYHYTEHSTDYHSGFYENGKPQMQEYHPRDGDVGEEKQLELGVTAGGNNYSIDYNDEFTILQTSYTLLLRGIRLLLLQRKIDFVRPLEELEFLVNKSKLSDHFLRWEQRPSSFISEEYNLVNYLNYQFQLSQYELYTISGNPAEIQSFLSHCHEKHTSLVLRHLLAIRRNAQSLYNMLCQLPRRKPLDYQELDQQLLQYFLVYWHNGITQQLLQLQYSQLTVERRQQQFLDCLFSPSSNPLSWAVSYEQKYTNGRKCFLLFISSFLCLVTALQILFLIYLDPSSTSWYWVNVIVLEGSYLCWIFPLQTLLHSVFLPRFIDSSHSLLIQLLSKRVKYLLQKRSHYLSNVFSTIQFFHPVVRVARLLPASAVSRIFMTLTDHDLPTAELLRLKNSSHPIYFVWQMDYANIHRNVWSEENPLLIHRIQLLLENWKIRCFYFLFQVHFFLGQLVRWVLSGILHLPHPCLQQMIEELTIALFSFGSILLISYYWQNGIVVALVVLVASVVVLFTLLDVSFNWTSSLWESFFARLKMQQQQILKYRKKRKKRGGSIKIYPQKMVISENALEKDEEANWSPS